MPFHFTRKRHTIAVDPIVQSDTTSSELPPNFHLDTQRARTSHLFQLRRRLTSSNKIKNSAHVLQGNKLLADIKLDDDSPTKQSLQSETISHFGLLPLSPNASKQRRSMSLPYPSKFQPSILIPSSPSASNEASSIFTVLPVATIPPLPPLSYEQVEDKVIEEAVEGLRHGDIVFCEPEEVDLLPVDLSPVKAQTSKNSSFSSDTTNPTAHEHEDVPLSFVTEAIDLDRVTEPPTPDFPGTYVLSTQTAPILKFIWFILHIIILSISFYLNHYISSLVYPVVFLRLSYTNFSRALSKSTLSFETPLRFLIYVLIEISAIENLVFHLTFLGVALSLELIGFREGWVNGWQAVQEVWELTILGTLLPAIEEKWNANR